MLTKYQILIIAIVAIVLLVFITFTIWWWFIRKPSTTPSKSTCTATEKNTICLSNGVVAAVENQFDENIPTPLSSLVLNSFSASYDYAPWCIPSFYAIRFVDTNGNYGPLSGWYGPIVASSSTNPGGCGANIPYFRIQDATDPNIKKYYVNVHRQDKELDETNDGMIIGMVYKDLNTFIDDPSTNPNANYSEYPCKDGGCD